MTLKENIRQYQHNIPNGKFVYGYAEKDIKEAVLEFEKQFDLFDDSKSRMQISRLRQKYKEIFGDFKEE